MAGRKRAKLPMCRLVGRMAAAASADAVFLDGRDP